MLAAACFSVEKSRPVRRRSSALQEKKEDAVRGSTATLSVSFSNPGDGIIPLHELKGAESELKLPWKATKGNGRSPRSGV